MVNSVNYEAPAITYLHHPANSSSFGLNILTRTPFSSTLNVQKIISCDDGEFINITRKQGNSKVLET
jgi:hypothetical protein